MRTMNTSSTRWRTSFPSPPLIITPTKWKSCFYATSTKQARRKTSGVNSILTVPIERSLWALGTSMIVTMTLRTRRRTAPRSAQRQVPEWRLSEDAVTGTNTSTPPTAMSNWVVSFPRETLTGQSIVRTVGRLQ